MLDRLHLNRALLSKPKFWMAVALAVPFVIAAIQTLNRAQYPFFTYGDQALIDFAVRRATNFEQLHGPYSRFGFDHPGPLYFYILALFYWVADTPIRLYFGALVLNAVVVGFTFAMVAKRLNTAAALWFTLVLATYLMTLGPFFIRDPWNPATMVLPLFAAFVMTALRPSVVTTSLAIFAASLALQAHIGAIAVIVPIALVLIGLHLASTRRGGAWLVARTEPQPLIPVRRSILIAGAVLLACWAVPIIEQLVRVLDGNFGKIVYYFLFLSDGSQRSAEVAADLVLGASWLPVIPTLTVPPAPPVPALLLMAMIVALSVLGAVVAWRRQQRFALAGFAFVAVGLPLATLSIMRIDRLVEVYLLWWVSLYPIALLLAAGMVWFEERKAGRPSVRVVAIGLVLMTLGSTYSSLFATPRNESSRREVAQLWNFVEPHIDKDVPLYLDIADEQAVAYVAGLAVKLNEEGYRYELPEVFEEGFGQSGADAVPRQTIRFAVANTPSDVGDVDPIGTTSGRIEIRVRVFPPAPTAVTSG